MAYYHDLITEKSFAELKTLQQTLDFVLIGGWAIYFYTHQLKSKDIDIIINYDQLPKLAEKYELTKNDRLAKYEARKGEVQIDIYLPYFSKLGIPVEKLIKQTKNIEGFSLIDSNYLYVLKLFTLTCRGRSTKGRKDFIDLISLIKSEQVDQQVISKIIKEYQIDNTIFNQMLSENFDLPELGLNRHLYAKLKNKLIS